MTADRHEIFKAVYEHFVRTGRPATLDDITDAVHALSPTLRLADVEGRVRNTITRHYDSVPYTEKVRQGWVPARHALAAEVKRLRLAAARS